MSDKKKITVLKEYRPLRDEELAAELTPTFSPKVLPMIGRSERHRIENIDDREVETKRSGMALTGVILSILSLFILPYLLAPIGIVLGYLGYRSGDQTVGMWAMGIGVVGLIGTLIMTAIVY
ncbi:hypothetical protein [Tepidibacillus marianensis]|uniref:hypothetical protein n=1 Tax=Tepidibacillus marianensis TaxID=3131995 RepID=UPI0030CC8DB8